MTEIKEPLPIKPIWPTRRDENPARRKKSDDEEDKQRPIPNKKPGKDQQPSIDEYV